ncbi:MAG: anaerobic ribonucleoside-triphosphate reductase activating protein [Ruminococcaceae bacterium]|nr:anaerobic ribonucleoside-triphosphate reductase activating protein [Oscillospiraceae bacterium]
MNVQGYQKLTLLDFPGRVACTVFTGGCNLRCPFCHNASLVLNPRESANLEEEVLSYLAGRRGILEGVCVTGGEPLLQPDLSDFVKQVKNMGFSVKLDTNGSDPAALEALLATGQIDYIAMDIKSSPEHYEKAIGKAFPMEKFLRSAEMIRSSGIEHEFRTTLVKGIHELRDMEGIGNWLAGEQRYFLQGFVDSGNLLGTGFAAFSPEEMKEFLQTVRKDIPSAKLRGQEEGE